MRARAAKMRRHARTLPEGLMLDINDFNTSVHSKRHTLPAEQGFGDRQSFFVLSVFNRGFPGLIVCAETRKRFSVEQNLRRVLRHIFCCVFSGGFWSHKFLKSTCTDFGGGLVNNTHTNTQTNTHHTHIHTFSFDDCVV